MQECNTSSGPPFVKNKKREDKNEDDRKSNKGETSAYQQGTSTTLVSPTMTNKPYQKRRLPPTSDGIEESTPAAPSLLQNESLQVSSARSSSPIETIVENNDNRLRHPGIIQTSTRDHHESPLEPFWVESPHISLFSEKDWQDGASSNDLKSGTIEIPMQEQYGTSSLPTEVFVCHRHQPEPEEDDEDGRDLMVGRKQLETPPSMDQAETSSTSTRSGPSPKKNKKKIVKSKTPAPHKKKILITTTTVCHPRQTTNDFHYGPQTVEATLLADLLTSSSFSDHPNDKDDEEVGMLVPEPTEADVLCCRGGKSNHWLGNRVYRNVVKILRPRYQCPSSDKHAKTRMSKAVVRYMIESKGARFLRKSEKDGKFYTISQSKHEARKKAFQLLRESKDIKWIEQF